MKNRRRQPLLALLLLLVLALAAGCGTAKPENPTPDQKMLISVKPAVVRPVTVVTITWQLSNQSVVDLLGSNPYKQTFSSTGSGWFVSPDGYVVTNAHVASFAHMNEKELAAALFPRLTATIAQRLGQNGLTQAQEQIVVNGLAGYNVSKTFFVLTPGGERLPAEIKSYGVPIGDDISGKDVAILKVEGNNFPTLTPGNSDNVKDADKVYIVGYPGAADMDGLFDEKSILESTTSDGSIQARKNTAQGTPVIQLGGAINPGNSGGPVVNQKGEVIGIATYKAAQGEGVNFAVPMNTIMEFVRSAGTAPKASDTTTRFGDGMNLYWDGKYDKAIKKFEELLRVYPSHALAKKYVQEAQSHMDAGPQLDSTLLIAVAGGAVLLVAIVVVFFLMRGKRKQAPAMSQYAPGTVPQHQGTYSAPTEAAFSYQAPATPIQPGYAAQPQPTWGQAAPVQTPAQQPQEAPTGPAFLHFLAGPLRGVRLPIPATGFYIGSDPGSGGLTVPDPALSPRHCWIGPSEGGYVVVIDMGSAGGTYVGGLAAGRVQQAALLPGNDIYLGAEGSVIVRYEY